MGTPTPTSLELLAATSAKDFVEAFLTGAGLTPETYNRSASGTRSPAATLNEFDGRWADHKSKNNVEGLSIKTVQADGGGEGEGETVYRVFAVVKDGVEIAHISCGGYYASEYGIDWDDSFQFVYPRQVVVTQYFTTKE